MNRMKTMVVRLIIALFAAVTCWAADADSSSIASLRASALEGSALAQWKLGKAYLSGEGVAQDTAEGMKWIIKAAEQGNAVAQDYMGVMYANGSDVAKDDAEAVKWIIKAAEQGDVDAQYMLGVSYYGLIEGVPEDRVEAKKWLRKAAAQGCAEAQEFLNKVGW